MVVKIVSSIECDSIGWLSVVGQVKIFKCCCKVTDSTESKVGDHAAYEQYGTGCPSETWQCITGIGVNKIMCEHSATEHVFSKCGVLVDKSPTFIDQSDSTSKHTGVEVFKSNKSGGLDRVVIKVKVCKYAYETVEDSAKSHLVRQCIKGPVPSFDMLR